jgi:hypothetical protein
VLAAKTQFDADATRTRPQIADELITARKSKKLTVLCY